MKTPPKHVAKILLTTFVLVLVAFLLLRRGAFFFLPFFVMIPFWLWRGGDHPHEWEGEDPADWWKKGKKPE